MNVVNINQRIDELLKANNVLVEEVRATRRRAEQAEADRDSAIALLIRLGNT